MKKTLLFSLFLFLLSPVFAGEGTKSNPYTVAEAIKKTNSSSAIWIKAYIVGEMSEFSNNKYFYELAPPFSGSSALLIADNSDEIDLSKCMPVQLGNFKEENYLDENPEIWRKEVLVCGFTRDYFSMPGIKNITDLEFENRDGFDDEALYWNFFENMDEKTYTPTSNEHTFAGGTYVGATGNWLFKGATWGDSGKDQKWGKASARIRLTEGSTGEKGYIQMTDDKKNGIGTVRFWAGNYEEDSSGGTIALYISSNQGNTWEKFGEPQSISKKWKEYQVFVNKIGDIRLRIAKDDDSSKGINVDKIRISDYYKKGNSTDDADYSEIGFSYYTDKQGLHLNVTENNIQVNIYAMTGVCVWENSLNQGIYNIALDKGIYILKTRQRSFKIICK